MTHNVERIDVPHLIVETEGLAAGPVALGDELSIGRAEDNDLELLDPKVSRHHARITRQGAAYVVTDLGSANGTLIDGVPLVGPHTLQHGERITVGDSEFTYHEPGRTTDITLKTPTPTLVGQKAVVPAPPVGYERAADYRLPEAREASGTKESRGPIVGLLLTGGVLLLAIIAVGAYLLLPKLRQGGQETAVAATPLAQASGAVVTTMPGAETPGLPAGSSVATTQPTTSTQALSDQEMDDLLTQAKGLALKSNFEAAATIYEDLVKRAPNDPRPQIGWAWASIWDHEPEQAELHAQKAFDLNPNNVEAVVALARALIDKGEKARALAVAQQAVAIGSSNASARTVLAEALRLNERYAEAVDEADRALVLDNNNADAHRARGWLYYLADQDVGQANGQLQIALSLQTELWMRRHEYGELLLQEGNYTTALIAFQDALQLRSKAVTYTAIGEAYYQLGQYDPARISLEQAESAGAKDARTQSLLAATFAKLGRCVLAGPYITQVLAVDAGNALALEAQAACPSAALTPSPSDQPEPSVQPTTEVAEVTVTPTTTPTPTATRQAPAASISGRIAFPAWNNETKMYDVWVINVDGTGRRKVVANMEMPAFSPDGKWLAVKGVQSDMQNLYIIRPNGTELRRVSENIEDRLPTWSPDNGRIAYASTKQGPDHPKKIYVNDKPFEGRKPSSREIVSDRGPVQGVRLHWMPDGRIVYQGCDYQPDPDVCGLFIIADGGGKFTQITRDPRDTAPAGHGGRIAFMSSRDGNWEIYVIREDGTGLKRLTNNASDDGLPTWSPDGKTIAFISNQGGAWAVWAMNADGSSRRELFDIGGGGLQPYWSEMGLSYEWLDQRISWAP